MEVVLSASRLGKGVTPSALPKSKTESAVLSERTYSPAVITVHVGDVILDVALLA